MGVIQKTLWGSCTPWDRELLVAAQAGASTEPTSAHSPTTCSATSMNVCSRSTSANSTFGEQDANRRCQPLGKLDRLNSDLLPRLALDVDKGWLRQSCGFVKSDEPRRGVATREIAVVGQ